MTPLLRAVAPLALSALSAACEDPGKGALRNAGEECLDCHRSGGKAFDHPLTAGGTVHSAPGAGRDGGAGWVEVVLRDARGREHRLPANAVGNFWAEREIAFPVSAWAVAPGAAPPGPRPPTCASGRCNQCHGSPPSGGARGRLVAAP